MYVLRHHLLKVIIECKAVATGVLGVILGVKTPRNKIQIITKNPEKHIHNTTF